MSENATPTLDKTYTPSEVEEALYGRWEQAGDFAAQPDSKSPPYTIMMPPPNVTGSLHIGHALTFTLQDILIRYNRMIGKIRCGSPAPTTPASRRRWSLSVSLLNPAPTVATWAAKPS